MLRIVRTSPLRLPARILSSSISRPGFRSHYTMPVPFTKLRDEAELAILSVLRGCYL